MARKFLIKPTKCMRFVIVEKYFFGLLTSYPLTIYGDWDEDFTNNRLIKRHSYFTTVEAAKKTIDRVLTKGAVRLEREKEEKRLSEAFIKNNPPVEHPK